MLIQLFEAITPLLEINYDKTKGQWFKKLTAKAIQDVEFWNYYNEKTPPEDRVGGGSIDDDDDDDGAEAGFYSDEDKARIYDFAYNAILEFDPTNGRANGANVYTLWMINKYCNATETKGITSWEDMETTAELLAQYDRLKVRDVFNRMAKDPEANTTKDWAKWVSNINNVDGKAALAEFVRHGANWLKDKAEHKFEMEFEKYNEWATAGGIEIAYPPPGIPHKQALKQFEQDGMVLTLKSRDASVALFKDSTAWCTARENNQYYHGSYGKSPLHVIVDNQGGKLFQFHENTRSFLDENDGHNFEVLAIPFPLLRVASELIDEDIPGLADLAGQTLDEHIVRLLDEAENMPGPNGVNFWNLLRKRDLNKVDGESNENAVNQRQIRMAFARYYASTRTIPPEDQLFEFIRDHFDSIPHLTGVDALNISTFTWEIMNRGKPSDKLLLKLLETVSQTIAAIEIIYSTFWDTNIWPQARKKIVDILKLGNDTTMLGSSVGWETGYMKPKKSNARAGIDMHGFFDTMQFTEEEADTILENTKEWGYDVAQAMQHFWNAKVFPSSKHVARLLHTKVRVKGSYPETLTQIIFSYSIEKYYPLLNLMDLLHMTDQRGEPINGMRYGLLMWVAGKDYFLPQITPEFITAVFDHDLGWEVFNKTVADNATVEWLHTKPIILRQIIDIMIARAYRVDWGHLFILFEEKIYRYITPQDIANILGGIIDAGSTAFTNVVCKMLHRLEAPRVARAQNTLATKPVLDMIISKIRVAMRRGLMTVHGGFWGLDVVVPYQRITGQMAPEKLWRDILAVIPTAPLISMVADMIRDSVMFPEFFVEAVRLAAQGRQDRGLPR